MNARVTAACAAVALAAPAAVLAQQSDPYALPAPASGTAPGPEPVVYASAVAARERGTVLYRSAGQRRYRRLREPTLVAFPASIDARKGRVRLTVARDSRGRVFSADFYDGKFTLTQEESPAVAVLGLAGGSFKETCPVATAASAKRRAKRRVRRLWGDGSGRFRTRGRYSAATVRGTKWLTADLCEGTLTRVARGIVEVEDFTEPLPVSKPQPGAQTPGASPAPVSGGGEDGGRATPRGKRVKVRRGGSYVAGP